MAKKTSSKGGTEVKTYSNAPTVAPRSSTGIFEWKDACRVWIQAKNPILVFVALFALLLASFYAVTLSQSFQRLVFPVYLSSNARVSAGVLNLLGQKTAVEGRTIRSPHFSIEIRRGCDAVDPIALFAAALLAFPAPWRRKLPGLAAGMLLLAGLNLVRIVSLFLVGRFFPKAFDLMHLEVWQAVFIVVAVVTWAGWIGWALKPFPDLAEPQPKT